MSLVVAMTVNDCMYDPTPRTPAWSPQPHVVNFEFFDFFPQRGINFYRLSVFFCERPFHQICCLAASDDDGESGPIYTRKKLEEVRCDMWPLFGRVQEKGRMSHESFDDLKYLFFTKKKV